MDITSARPAVGSASVGRPETVQYREAVRTELPPMLRVDQPAVQNETASTDDRRPGDGAKRQAAAVTNGLPQGSDAANTVYPQRERRIDKDEEAGTLVYRTIDAHTGDVVNQYPDDMILKLRTYAREMARKDQQFAEYEKRIEKLA